MVGVDIVVPCYKYAHYLRGCVESVLSQEGVDVRVLIIDDCSPDNTPEVAAELVRQDNRVEYRRHDVNRGHIDTYNEGLIEWTSGQYCLLLSADDLLARGALIRAAEVFSANANVGLVHGRQVAFAAEPPRCGVLANPSLPNEILDGPKFIEECCEVAGNPVATPTAVVRTTLQKQVGGYRKNLPHSADMEMWLRLASRAAVARVDAVQAFKRTHATNMQHCYLTTHLGDLKQREATFDSFFSAEGHGIQNASQLRQLAGRQLAKQAFWAANNALDQGDKSSARMCLDFALRLDPELESTREWSRLKYKRRIGPVWSVVRPLIDRLRGGRLAKTD